MPEIQSIHIDLSLTLNTENSYRWSDPNVRRTFNMSLPAPMFTAKAFSDLVADAIKEMQAEFPKAVAEYEAEQKAKEESGE